FPHHSFRLAPLTENAIHQESPAVGYPPYVLQHVLAFLPNSFGFLMHRGGRDARVPVRRRFAAMPRAKVETQCIASLL
ncbi:MAG: hypothetical protein LBQ66_07330, partial [Planctomycetaceae bacterium]|nr:hypothetical protein [Planctomycetaceae bacterium]